MCVCIYKYIYVVMVNHAIKKPPTPCLWQAPASTQKTKRKTRPANQAGHSSERTVEGQTRARDYDGFCFKKTRSRRAVPLASARQHTPQVGVLDLAPAEQSHVANSGSSLVSLI